MEVMLDVDLQKRVLETLEAEGSLPLSQIDKKVDEKEPAVENAISQLVDRNLIMISDSEGERQVKCVAPVPISELSFRGDLSPTQAVIRYLYEEQGYGQSQIARMLDYSPGNIQTNLDRIEEKLSRKLEQ